MFDTRFKRIVNTIFSILTYFPISIKMKSKVTILVKINKNEEDNKSKNWPVLQY